MNTKKNLMYAGMCLTVLTCALGVKSAFSASSTEVVTVTVSSPLPDVFFAQDITWSGTPLFAVNAKTTTATIIVSPLGVVTGNANVFPNARLSGDATGTALRVQVGGVTAGAPNAAMSFKIEDNTAHTAIVNVTDGVVGDAPFTVGTWTAGTPVTGTLTGFSGATGLGTLTLSALGAADVAFGATLSTVKDALPKPYGSATYTGTVAVIVNY